MSWIDEYNFDLNTMAEDFSAMLQSNDKSRVDYIKQLLEDYKDKSSSYPGLPSLEKELDIQTLFGYIQDKADINNHNLPDYIRNNGNEIPFWNESVNNIVNKILRLFSEGVLTSIPTREIKQSDAALTFDREDSNYWVSPQKNLNGDSYGSVRGADREITSDSHFPVLENDTQLTFTNEQNSEGIYNRLIMPKNTRRVEVEDLNRNFWVISQQTTGILNFLFNDNGVKGILADLLNEIAQTWQNVFYLWSAAALLAAEKDNTLGIHCEVLYLPNDEYQPYKKYDNFDFNWELDSQGFIKSTTFNKNIILNRLKFLKEKYPKHDLCILPCIRYQNYSHNYYYSEYYPYLYFYDRDKKENILKPLTGYYGYYIDNVGITNSLVFNVDTILPAQNLAQSMSRKNSHSEIGKFLYGVNKERNIYYYPYNRIKIYNKNRTDNYMLCDVGENKEYEALLEVKPTLSCEKINGVLTATLSFDVYDAAARIIFNDKTSISNSGTYIIDNSNEDSQLIYFPTISSKSQANFTSYDSADNCYKGELVTNYDYSAYRSGGDIHYDTTGLDIANQGTLLKIGSYFPDTTATRRLPNEGVVMGAAIDNTWKEGPIREVLDSAGKRTGIKCNLTIGNKGETYADYQHLLSTYYAGHNLSNPLNPVTNASQSIFAEQQLFKSTTDNKWYLIFSKVWDADKISYNRNSNSSICGIKGLSAQMSQKYLQYAFELEPSNSNYLDPEKINYIITTIGVSAWAGGAQNSQQGYQGYWEQNILCYYVRYVPTKYLKNEDGTIGVPSILYPGGEAQNYPIYKNSTKVGYIDTVAPINLAEGFVGDFLTNILRPDPSGSGDHWRLPQLNASNKTDNVIYKVVPTTGSIQLNYYNKETNQEEEIIIADSSTNEEWYVTNEILGIPADSSDEIVKAAIETYQLDGYHQYTAKEILNSEYGVTGIWNIFDGYTSSVVGNKESYVGGDHTHVLQIFFEFDSHDNKFIIDSDLGNSQYRRYNSSAWSNYAGQACGISSDNPLGDALPSRGYIFSSSTNTLSIK